MTSLVIGASIFTMATIFLYAIASSAPSITALDKASENQTHIRFPRSLDDLSALVRLLSFYKQHYFYYVVLLFCSAYLYKQCFAIPGSVFMNILSGAIFGVTFGFPLVCILTGVGATCCFLLSKHFGKTYVERFFPEKVRYLQQKVKGNMDSLFFFLLFLRLFPMSPNWFLNIASPMVDIPIHYFFFSVLIGLMPYNIVCVQTGSILSQITSIHEMFTSAVLLKMVGVAALALLPPFLLKQYQKTKKWMS